jgi:thiol:disulfide interchange protein DsbA
MLRTFARIAARIATVGLLAAYVVGAAAQPAAPPAFQPTAGRHYQELRPPHPVSSGERIEVIEFFYYGCPICYETQPHLAKWLFTRGADVVLVRVPAMASQSWEPFARTYFTLDSIGELARLHWPVYDNFHFDGKKLNEERTLVEWVSANGVDGARFRQVWSSPETRAKMDRAKQMLVAYEVTGVPAFVVDGKYLTSARMSGGVRQMVEVVDFLVNRARNERPKR